MILPEVGEKPRIVWAGSLPSIDPTDRSYEARVLVRRAPPGQELHEPGELQVQIRILVDEGWIPATQLRVDNLPQLSAYRLAADRILLDLVERGVLSIGPEVDL